MAARMTKQGANVWIIMYHTDSDQANGHTRVRFFSLPDASFLPEMLRDRDYEP